MTWSAAEASLRRAIELDRSLAGAHTALGLVLAGTDRRDEAIEEWKRALAIDAGELNALYNLTINLVAAGRKRRSERVWGTVHRRGPEGVTDGCGGDKEGVGTVGSRQSVVVGHSPQSESSEAASPSRQSKSSVAAS